jgi:glyoxylase-like metal-dependent hydrolase (beta-lactamase superfamily II)/rhodanese-related sulfurtransferase
MNTVAVETLRTWLEEQRPVTLLDIRPTQEYVEWSISGSIHVDAYDALKAHDPKALADVELPAGQPVVTICALGRTSRIAADQLRARGLQALSLEGGMKAWSLAWNTAEVLLRESAARMIQVRRTGKGCLSYLIGADGMAAVIDASLDPQVYLDLAARYGWRITHVLDTHIHADHLSRSRQLAQRSGATLYLPDQQRASFPFTLLRNGDTLSIGRARLTAIHTPGHTPESTSYLLDQQALLTGDTLFPTGVGRPDLAATPQEARQRAAILYRSLHTLLARPSDTLVLPGHTSTPVAFNKEPIMTTLAEIQEQGGLIRVSHDAFVEHILARIPPTPPNYEWIIGFNEAGILPEENPIELEAGANRCAIS